MRHAFDNSSTLNSLIESDVGISPTIYEITISDKNGIVLVSSDASLRDQKVASRPPVSSLVRAGFFQQLRELYGPPQTYEYSLAFHLGTAPFGDIRMAFLRPCSAIKSPRGCHRPDMGARLGAALDVAGFLLVSRIALAPIERISAQLDRISAGQFDAEPAVERGDELGAVSTKIVGIGKQLRDVREIFSTLRENLDQVMSGSRDGLLLFNGRGPRRARQPVGRKISGRPAGGVARAAT